MTVVKVMTVLTVVPEVTKKSCFLFIFVLFFFNLKTHILTKLKNSNYGKTQKCKFWQNLKTQIVTKLENSNCDKTQKLKLGQNSKLKLWQNSKTQIMTKLKLWHNSKTWIVTKLKLKQVVTKWKKSKLWPNIKNQILTKLKNFVWVWNSSFWQTGRRFESHRWCMEFVTKRGCATRIAKGLLLYTVAPK